MRVKSKIISASLFTSVLFLTACSGGIELEQSCVKLALHDDMSEAEANSLCACAASEIKTSFSKSEQRIFTAVFSDFAKLTEAGSRSSPEIELVILNSDLDYAQSKALADRFQQKIRKCAP